MSEWNDSVALLSKKKTIITSRYIIVLHCNSVNEFDATWSLAIHDFHETYRNVYHNFSFHSRLQTILRLV